MLSVISKRISGILYPPFLGIDISDLTIKFAKISKDREGINKKIDYFGEINIEKGLVSEGEIKKEKELIDILKNNLKDLRNKKISEKFVVASLPEEKSFVRIIQLPKLKPAEIASAVRWELEANIPLLVEQVYFDYEIINSPEIPLDHTDVLITAFPRLTVDSYISVIRSAGYYPLAIELESQAISRTVITNDLINDAVIIVDIGMTRTSFMVFGGGSIILTISIRLGGQDFNKAIAEKLGIPLEEAGKIKKEYGLNKNYKNGIMIEALIPLLPALVEEIRKQIWFYKDRAEHRHGGLKDISKIILVGGDANLIGLEKFLSISLKKPVITADPFVNVYGNPHKIVPPIPKNASLKYTTAIGLALRE